MQVGSAAWMLDQAKGYVVAFALTVLTIVPLVLFGLIDPQWLVVPAAFGITSALLAPLFLGHRYLTARRRRRDHDDSG